MSSNKSLIRYDKIRKADDLNDQKTASEIQAALSASVTQEDLQEYLLSQVKRIIFGDAAGTWNTDFVGAGISPLVTAQTADTHKTLRQLIHFLDDGPGDGFSATATKEVIGGMFPTEIRWKDASGHLIVKKTITRSGGGATVVKPNPIVWQVYASDGSTVLATATDVLVYSGISETGRTRTFS